VSTIGILCGVLGKDGEKLAEARARLAPVFSWTTSGDGFYRDGSFIQQHCYAYTGGYGLSLIGLLARLAYLLAGTPWDLEPHEKAMISAWMYRAYRPLLHQGAMMDMVRGREISRAPMQDRLAGRLLIQAATILASTEGLPEQSRLKPL